MQPDNKHKIFSKEELFKLIEEKKSLPPDADDFDKEAMEGLSMLTNRKKVDGLNNSIDEVLLLEKKKANKKRSIYILSAAASIILIISFFFLLKNNSFEKQDKVLAENTKTGNEIKQDESPKAAVTETAADERERSETKANSPITTVNGEASGKGKEEKKLESEIAAEQNKNISKGDAMAVPPMAPPEKKVSNTENFESPNKEESQPLADNDSRNTGGKDYKAKITQEEEVQVKREEAKKAVAKTEDKEKDKTKYRTNAASNTTTTPANGAVAFDESKNKAGDDGTQNKLDQTTTVTGNNAAPLKEAETVANEKQIVTTADKKSAQNHEQIAKPDTTVTDMLAGYSYSANKPDRAAAGVTGELQKSQQQSPSQTQNNAGYYHTPTPEFMGGEITMQDYINKNLKISNPNKTGTIDVKFLVKKDGSIDTTSIKIIKSIKDCAACNQDVINLIKGMPKLKPNTSTGKETENFQVLSVPYAAGPNTK